VARCSAGTDARDTAGADGVARNAAHFGRSGSLAGLAGQRVSVSVSLLLMVREPTVCGMFGGLDRMLRWIMRFGTLGYMAAAPTSARDRRTGSSG